MCLPSLDRFRSKYHPEEYEKRKTEQTNALKKRLSVFLDLLNNQWIDSVSVDVEKANQIIRLLDAAVIKLEGGTDFDLKALDEKFEEEKTIEPDLSLFAVEVEKPPKSKPEREAGEESDSEDVPSKEEENVDKKQNNGEDANDNKQESSEQNNKQLLNINQDSVGSMEEGEASMDAHSDSNAPHNNNQNTETNIKSEEKGESTVKGENSNNSDSERPRPLHKTLSIFMRNLAPSLTKAELEEVINYLFEKRFNLIE